MSRRQPKFHTRTPEEDVSRLAPSESAHASPDETRQQPSWRPDASAALSRQLSRSPRNSQQGSRFSPSHLFSGIPRWWRRRSEHETHNDTQGRILAHTSLSQGHISENTLKDKMGQKSRSTDSSHKLGTVSGVFVPTTLNVLSILMFLRFGFILGQSGALGMLGLLIIAYTINLLTVMSLSAIATNGTVRGGGAYYLISRSLGPEFGGCIGIIFYFGYVLNTGMNAVGLVNCFTQNFGTETGTWINFLEEGFWWQYLWATIILVLCTGTCLAGSSIFARASNGLLIILLVAIVSIPVSAIILKPFSSASLGVEFTGIRLKTLMGNLKPRLTKGAAGSQLKGRENFQDLFGILFPATGGIFAGASMSGDLKNPSKSIPKGTLSGLALTFVTYTVVILAMAASITRASFYNNANVIQVTNLSGAVVLLGEFATSFFSSLLGVIGSAKLLQAVARDSLLPGLGIFAKGTQKSDEPVYGVMLTYVLAQMTMLFDINRIASFVTMAYLMTFLFTNLACFLLKIGSAPNFRPSFHYFNWQTAAAGTLLSGISMFFVDGLYATMCVGVLVCLFLLIHYSSPPKPWGDVSQSLIYHQVRKYLLRLRQEHVKFWRPQILLFINNFDDQFKMVSFCNSLKKGALFVLGHVLVTEDFSAAVPEARRLQTSWTKFVEASKVKAFVNIAVSPAAEWGFRNVVLNAGLGGMRPNIVIVDQFRSGQSLVETWQPGNRRSSGGRRTSHGDGNENSETTVQNPPMSERSYVTILEDLLFKLRMNVAVAKGFEDLELPEHAGRNIKKYIDLWPIQMSAELGADSESKQNVLTTNFDTYTLILQLGCILNTVPSWKKAYRLRVAVFVEYETDVEDERRRVGALLEKLRIEAEILVFWLACGDLKAYRIIVNGDTSRDISTATQDNVNDVLKDEDWWHDIQKARVDSREIHGGKPSDAEARDEAVRQYSSDQESPGNQQAQIGEGLEQLVQSSKRRRSVSSFRTIGGVSLGMQTHRLLDTLVDYDESDSTSDSDDSEFDLYTDAETGEYGNENDEDDTRTEQKKMENKESEPNVENESAVSSASASPSNSAAPGNDTPKPNVPAIFASGEGSSPKSPAPVRPPMNRSPSSNRFSSAPIPEAKVNTDEAGPSIMFADSSSPHGVGNKFESIYTHRSSSGPSGARPSASGYPGRASIPLSFNDLPSRAQHLILNELMAQQSEETAVIFTTLPSPFEATSQNEEASKTYLSDLEVLWHGLPPCLLVHSNSMTVTMNL